MQQITGKYATANIMTDIFEEEAYKQVLTVCNQGIFSDAKIRVMPDIHAGAGSVIGFTMPITNFVIPNIIGVDIGCGIDGYNLGKINLENFDFQEFDNHIRKNIPHGFSTHTSKVSSNSKLLDKMSKTIDNLKLKNPDRHFNSIGTLGGGNHFIELGKSDNDDIYLFIHSGSRNFGLQIALTYQDMAKEFISKSGITGVQKGLEYLLIDSEEGANYLHDMCVAQEFAQENRDIIAKAILQYFSVKPLSIIKTVHNYINFDDKIVRKGAIQANKDQKVVIPFNMRDGVIIGNGKGNDEWNNSAPHGAGRILARGQAKRTLNVEEFQETMKGVWSSCVNKDTIDESPMAYKPKEEILKYVTDTIDILDIVKPLYNFKATE